MSSYWAWGEKTVLARVSGQTKSRVSLILARKIQPGYKAALALNAAALAIGKAIPLKAWLDVKGTKHPAFSKKGV